MTTKNLNKLLICLMAISSSAFADEYIYGKLVAGLQNSQQQNTSAPGSSGVMDYGSYFGIRGDEYITEQASFIWQIEQLIDITSGQNYSTTTANGLIVPEDNTSSGVIVASFNQLANSDSYVGFQGGWGVVQLGNLSNYLRANMGAVDTFNYSNIGSNANGLDVWSRTSGDMILPNSFVYSSSPWHGVSLGFQYSFDSLLNTGSNATTNVPFYSQGQNGFYSGGIYSFGLAWVMDNFKVSYGGQLWPSVGSYPTDASGANPQPVPSDSQYNNAYINRLEVSYNDPDGLFAALGVQITNGLGWYGWANSGGSFNNYIVNAPYNNPGLSQAQYQTQEFAVSAGYHLGLWTPKLAYVYGNNMMYGGSIGSVLAGSASQIPDSGYQQIVAELDLNLDPRTIMFMNYGQIWFGSTLQNVSYCGDDCNGGNPVGNVNGSNQAFYNQSTFAIGLSHTF